MHFMHFHEKENKKPVKRKYKIYTIFIPIKKEVIDISHLSW